ncbi:hypothetical protein CKF96_04015 (plasmid) [Priestia filamentosa]|nr:hypothetical protein CKF96_04015 [Priestia filamentosa]
MKSMLVFPSCGSNEDVSINDSKPKEETTATNQKDVSNKESEKEKETTHEENVSDPEASENDDKVLDVTGQKVIEDNGCARLQSNC